MSGTISFTMKRKGIIGSRKGKVQNISRYQIWYLQTSYQYITYFTNDCQNIHYWINKPRNPEKDIFAKAKRIKRFFHPEKNIQDYTTRNALYNTYLISSFNKHVETA